MARTSSVSCGKCFTSQFAYRHRLNRVAPPPPPSAWPYGLRRHRADPAGRHRRRAQPNLRSYIIMAHIVVQYRGVYAMGVQQSADDLTEAASPL